MDDSDDTIVKVINPRTHLKKIWMSYTDYEIRVSTRNKAFVHHNSSVRRRFSEVSWLKQTLEKNSSLNWKTLFGNRFNQDFIEKRRASLEQFLIRVVNTPSYLSDVFLHLFLQTNLTVKEIERIVEGKDGQDITNFISRNSEMMNIDALRRMSTGNTNTDSGFSGSTNYEMNLSDNCISQCHVTGNGWSSGCTNSTRNKKMYRGRCFACRRKSLCNGASVLPTGQLLMAAESLQPDNEIESQDSSERCPEDSCTKCNQYDADDETDNQTLDYDIINIKTLHLRNWLSTVKAFSDTELMTSDDECVSEATTIPEYDVISVPCSSTSMPLLSSLQSTLVASKTIQEENENESSNNSEYSVVHSTIGGLELGTSKQLYDSASSLSSAGLYRTYDVVEMIEVQ